MKLPKICEKMKYAVCTSLVSRESTVHAQILGSLEAGYLRTFLHGNPCQYARHSVIAGLKWPPDVGAQTCSDAQQLLTACYGGRTYNDSKSNAEPKGQTNLEEGTEGRNDRFVCGIIEVEYECCCRGYTRVYIEEHSLARVSR